jgi:ATP-dependent DNA helicase RecQ
MHDQFLKTLQDRFKLKEFRKGQEEAITTLMTEGRTLCILPTGYGKSLLYQLPACLLDGITIVISPLLALMRDQIDQLNNRFNIPAKAINSDQSEEENFAARQAALAGELKILFIAPEQLDHVDRFAFLLNLNIKLVVVDEAHCISSWGHDFRPSYRQILHFLHAIYAKEKEIKILGLTATANERVEEDICKQLFFDGKKGVVLRQGMDRPNIQLSVIKTKGAVSKLAACDELLNQLEGSGLIYCATRENTELVADYLRMRGQNVAPYHAGYDVEQKKVLQQEFVSDKYKALAATNALGMGIDKGNLRFVIHFDFPGSITAYYQEVGRSGRDGQQAQGIVLFDYADRYIHEYFISSAQPVPEDFQQILDAVKQAVEPPGLIAIKSITGLHPTRVTIVIAELIEQQYLEKYSLNGKQVYRLSGKQGVPDLTRYTIQKGVRTRELEQIIQYAEQSKNCRMKVLRNALGDAEACACSHCDVCSMKGYIPNLQEQTISSISAWVDRRAPVIAPLAREKLSEGFSVLDSKMRSPIFNRFMQMRAMPPEQFEMDKELLNLLKEHLTALSQKEKITGIISVPSRTWQAKNTLINSLAEHLAVFHFDQILQWSEIPEKRQGELFNNDQRRDNVQGKMKAEKPMIPNPPADSSIILFDDYIGSGSTLKEAARALRAAGITNKIIPVTVAALKWHLGKPGFV